MAGEYLLGSQDLLSVASRVSGDLGSLGPQGNRISKQLQESDKKGIVPSGAFEFSA